jgi:hypothetical protein
MHGEWGKGQEPMRHRDGDMARAGGQAGGRQGGREPGREGGREGGGARGSPKARAMRLPRRLGTVARGKGAKMAMAVKPAKMRLSMLYSLANGAAVFVRACVRACVWCLAWREIENAWTGQADRRDRGAGDGQKKLGRG